MGGVCAAGAAADGAGLLFSAALLIRGAFDIPQLFHFNLTIIFNFKMRTIKQSSIPYFFYILSLLFILIYSNIVIHI